MKIAIIGAGFTGLTAAYELGKLGHKVTVFEKESHVGGLAVGFRGKPNWKWPLEVSYHHFFTNDDAIIQLSKELGMEKDLMVSRPVTATLCTELRHDIIAKDNNFRRSLPELWLQKNRSKKNIKNGKTSQTYQDMRAAEQENFYPERIASSNIFQLDSPINLLTFPRLSLLAKLRTAALLGFCKLNPFWKPLETITAKQLFLTIGGSEAWRVLWEPLMHGKFSSYSDHIPASWLWARIYKRTPRLGYFRGGFQTFAETLATHIRKQGGKIELETPIPSIKRIQGKNKFIIDNTIFDRVLITTPSGIAAKLLRFPKPFETQLKSIPHLYAQLLILETKKPILDTTYWLNINDRSFPFLALVQHTNMIDKKWYGGNHIAYVGNYLPEGHPYLAMTKAQLLKKFLPYLKRIHSSFIIRHSSLFTVPFAQPVHSLNYSHIAPGITTPIKNCFIANLDSIYPWDRGTNYAVELGKKAAQNIMRDA